jgi:phosphatidylserine/phosphatidylglycerophosphate/cardiolipin synthase-like enzyme
MRKALVIWLIGLAVGFLLGWFVSAYLPSSSHESPAPMGFSAPEAPLRVYFSPSPEPERAILQTLQSAQKFVHAALYQLTDPEIADALIEIARRGIELKILLDDEPSKGSKGCLLLERGHPRQTVR